MNRDGAVEPAHREGNSQRLAVKVHPREHDPESALDADRPERELGYREPGSAG
jgi:hypothetical protein